MRREILSSLQWHNLHKWCRIHPHYKIKGGIVMKRVLSGVFAVVCALAFAISATGAEKKAAKAGEKPTIEESTLVTVTATVEAIDQKTRMVTLKGPQGNMVTFKAGEQIKNLAQVKVGDTVLAKYYESVVVEVRKPGEAKPGVTTQEAVTRAKPGETPKGLAVSQMTVTTTIAAIDKKAPSVTLKGADGKSTTVKVRNPKNLENVKVGDQVVITYTEALALSLEKAPKK
jgi:hypothetical protein